MFQWDAVDISPDLWDKMSSKPSKTGANIVTDGPNSDTDTQTTPQRL